MQNSISVGNAGEHLVASYLLAAGFYVFIADRGQKAFDLAVMSGGKVSLLRVKTSSDGCVRWSSRDKHETLVFHDIQKEGDYCVFVLNLKHGIENAIFYTVPTSTVNKAIKNAHKKYMKTTKKNGEPKKINSLRAIRFFGDPSKSGYGFNKIWKKYLNEWEQLKG